MSKKPVFYKTLVIGIIILFLGVGIQPCVAVQSEEINDEPIVEITRPENDYIYVFDHKTIRYGLPFIPSSTTHKSAYAFGRPSLTIEVNVTQGYNVEYVSFKVFERTLSRGRVDLREYKDYDEPYQFKFTRYTIFPKNYDVYVDAIDTIGNVVGSDKIGLGYYRAVPILMYSLIQIGIKTSVRLFLLYQLLSIIS
jgi:hypothetical protein